MKDIIIIFKGGIYGSHSETIVTIPANQIKSVVHASNQEETSLSVQFLDGKFQTFNYYGESAKAANIAYYKAIGIIK